MRDIFVRTLSELMDRDERIFLITADMGYFIFDAIKKKYPRRFINLGIAEANMIGVCAGLALSGKIPFAYAITSFITSRAFEQIKVDVCYHKANVKIVGIGSGITYGTSGPTHQSIADIAIMRSLPHMTIFSPADPVDSLKITKAAYEHNGPVYIRLAKQGEPVINKDDYKFKIGKGVELRSGRDATIIATGSIINNALKAQEELERNGLKVRVINMHTLKPIDKDIILKAAEETKAILTLEEHNVLGGLGSIVAEVLVEEAKTKIKFRRLGLNDTFCLDYGSDECLHRKYQLDSLYITQAIKTLVREKR